MLISLSRVGVKLLPPLSRGGEKVLGQDHPDLATRYNNLAGLYYAQGHYGKAEPLYLKALVILETKLTLAHPNTKGGAYNYIDMLETLNRHGEAKALRAKYGL